MFQLFLKHQNFDKNLKMYYSCFENDILNKIQCSLMRYSLPGMPPYETTYEQRDNYKINYP